MNSLTGQLLVSMPQMDDPFFARSVVYIYAHTPEDGAAGLIVNKTVEGLTVSELCRRLQIITPAARNRSQPVHFGGPVQTDRALVLHSPDYRDQGTLRLGDEFAMTGTLDVLRAIGEGELPALAIVAVGYAGWGAGQLEGEIQANGWLSVTADKELVFDPDNAAKWHRALAKMGVSPELLSGHTGHA
jgi:putative transcriptional regulator